MGTLLINDSFNEKQRKQLNIMTNTYRLFTLPIKVSTRIRINEEERDQLIMTYNKQLDEGDLINLKLGMNNSTFMEMVRVEIQSVFPSF